MTGDPGKRGKPRTGSGLRVHGGVSLVAIGLLVLSACSTRVGIRTIQLQTLERGDQAEITMLGRAILTDPTQLGFARQELGRRMAVYQIRNPDDWAMLRAVAPDLADCPDLANGIAIAVASGIGTPLHGAWPVALESASAVDGAALVRVRFEGGNYLPDATTYIDVGYIRGVTDVLVVEINGVRFFPDSNEQSENRARGWAGWLEPPMLSVRS